MAIIVNKEEKRRNIALACRELLLENGINSLTISQIAHTAGVGKGTIYEYFDNKEDIVFEIITTFIIEHEEQLNQLIDAKMHTRQKLFHFLNFLFEDEVTKQHLKVYKEFLAISLLDAPQEMLDFSEGCHQRFMGILEQIIEAGRACGEIAPDKVLHTGTFALFVTGLVVDSRLESCDVDSAIESFLDMVLGTEY